MSRHFSKYQGRIGKVNFILQNCQLKTCRKTSVNSDFQVTECRFVDCMLYRHSKAGKWVVIIFICRGRFWFLFFFKLLIPGANFFFEKSQCVLDPLKNDQFSRCAVGPLKNDQSSRCAVGLSKNHQIINFPGEFPTLCYLFFDQFLLKILRPCPE